MILSLKFWIKLFVNFYKHRCYIVDSFLKQLNQQLNPVALIFENESEYFLFYFQFIWKCLSTQKNIIWQFINCKYRPYCWKFNSPCNFSKCMYWWSLFSHDFFFINDEAVKITRNLFFANPTFEESHDIGDGMRI